MAGSRANRLHAAATGGRSAPSVACAPSVVRKVLKRGRAQAARACGHVSRECNRPRATERSWRGRLNRSRVLSPHHAQAVETGQTATPAQPPATAGTRLTRAGAPYALGHDPAGCLRSGGYRRVEVPPSSSSSTPLRTSVPGQSHAFKLLKMSDGRVTARGSLACLLALDLQVLSWTSGSSGRQAHPCFGSSCQHLDRWQRDLVAGGLPGTAA
jgi:hypothetical protein